ncbi:MAG: hypothetical protein ACRC7N_22020 [Clostridium sp.]
MKRKVICSVLTVLIIGGIVTNGTAKKAFAFGGYAHWDIARRTMDYQGVTSGNTRREYQSGVLMADLGRLNWDTYYTDTDKEVFSRKLKDIAVSSKFGNRMNFGKGWYDHFLQDKNGSVSGIIGSSGSYRLQCGQIDEYLRDDRKIVTPINGKTYAYVDYTSIRETYRALDNFAPTDSQIDTEIKRMYTGYHQAIAANFSGMSSSQINRMDSQFNTLSRNGYGVRTSRGIIESTNYENINKINNMDNYEVFANILNNDKSGKLKGKLDEALLYTSLEKEEVEGGVYKVTFKIDDAEKYNKQMEELTSMINKML